MFEATSRTANFYATRQERLHTAICLRITLLWTSEPSALKQEVVRTGYNIWYLSENLHCQQHGRASFRQSTYFTNSQDVNHTMRQPTLLEFWPTLGAFRFRRPDSIKSIHTYDILHSFWPKRAPSAACMA
eukprot:6161090-Pleurochrysis_carterae.AAC.1